MHTKTQSMSFISSTFAKIPCGPTFLDPGLSPHLHQDEMFVSGCIHHWNFFSCHSTHHNHQMVIEIFWLLKMVWVSAIILEKQPLFSFLSNQKLFVAI
jgi:hypothetical protein